MRILLLAVGQKMPAWIEQGYQEYAQRMPAEARLELKEIAPGKRGKNADIKRIIEDEGQRLIAAIPRSAHIVYWMLRAVLTAPNSWRNVWMTGCTADRTSACWWVARKACQRSAVRWLTKNGHCPP